jgi:hypothetical protein
MRSKIIRQGMYRRGMERKIKRLLLLLFVNNYMIRLLSRSCLFGDKGNKWSRESKLLFDLMESERKKVELDVNVQMEMHQAIHKQELNAKLLPHTKTPGFQV